MLYSSFIVSYFTFTINDILDQTCNIYFFKLPCANSTAGNLNNFK